MKLADLLAPIVGAMKTDLLTEPYVGTDDTPIKAYREIKKGRRKLDKAYLWPYCTDRHVIFDFTASRARAGPEDFLGNFEGYLQTDGYAGYHRLRQRPRIVGVGCMAHARRKFYDALTGKAPIGLVLPIMALMRQLYAIEKEARERDMTPLRRLRERTMKSRPLLAAMLRAARAIWKNDDVLLDGALGDAVRYLLSQRRTLTRYTRDGMLEIDNNRVERAIRPIALGRKNWLFAGSKRGGHAAATIYSLVETCKIHDAHVERYFAAVFAALANDHRTDPASLTPEAWKRSVEAQSPKQATVDA